MEPVQDMFALKEMKKAKLAWEREQRKPLAVGFVSPGGEMINPNNGEAVEAEDLTPETKKVQITAKEADEMLAQPLNLLLNPGADTTPERRRNARRILKAHGFST